MGYIYDLWNREENCVINLRLGKFFSFIFVLLLIWDTFLNCHMYIFSVIELCFEYPLLLSNCELRNYGLLGNVYCVHRAYSALYRQSKSLQQRCETEDGGKFIFIKQNVMTSAETFSDP